MMNPNSIVVGLILSLGSSLSAQTLELPPRQPAAQNGTAFARSIADLALAKREERIVAEFLAGNVPLFLRQLVPVHVSAGNLKASFFVAPDYLAIGSDDDYFLAPLTPLAAQVIADRLDCVLPTPKMVDDIYESATVKLAPAPIPPSPAMTTVAVFLRHNEIVRAARQETYPWVRSWPATRKMSSLRTRFSRRPERWPSTAGTSSTASRFSRCTRGIRRRTQTTVMVSGS